MFFLDVSERLKVVEREGGGGACGGCALSGQNFEARRVITLLKQGHLDLETVFTIARIVKVETAQTAPLSHSMSKSRL